MGLLQKLLVDCSAPPGQQTTTAPLTADEVTAYTAQQPAGVAEQAAYAADLAQRHQHAGALGQLRAALTANSTLTQSDLAAAPTIVQTLMADGTLTAAQQRIYDRLVLRALAVLLGA